jgi:Holliday junction resolvase
MSVNSREKGKRGERELSHLLNQYGYATRRGQQYSGANGDADVVGLDRIHIECKNVEKLNLRDAMLQSEHDALVGEIPVVMHKKNRKPWLVTLNLNDFMNMYNSWIKENDCEVDTL